MLSSGSADKLPVQALFHCECVIVRIKISPLLKIDIAQGGGTKNDHASSGIALRKKLVATLP